MLLELVRTETGDDGTFGRLSLNGIFVAYTAELPEYGGDPTVHNEQRTDCVPVGEYHCEMRYSPTFKQNLYWVKDVPGREWVLIHSGNVAGNTSKGKKTDVAGCILLGLSMGKLHGQTAVLDSRKAMQALYGLTEKKPIKLRITREYEVI